MKILNAFALCITNTLLSVVKYMRTVIIILALAWAAFGLIALNDILAKKTQEVFSSETLAMLLFIIIPLVVSIFVPKYFLKFMTVLQYKLVDSYSIYWKQSKNSISETNSDIIDSTSNNDDLFESPDCISDPDEQASIVNFETYKNSKNM